MVISSPCLTDIKNWLVQSKRLLLASPKQTALALAIPEQTATGKEISNPFMAVSLDLSRLATTLNRLERSIQIGINRSRSELHINGKIGSGTDFIVKRPKEDSSNTPMEVEEELSEPWILFTDRSSCAAGSGAGLILTNPEGTEFTYALRFSFEATNNEAEYEALIAGLRIAEQMGVKNL
ncbi:reverse transcriptase domain-containing protein [Tanacetum coccineum]|uniref:Reverse transcriptase domain-containing protein n=1 Tax=Tanacetum coccineum TaxID=301880 RepID=A0ABQ5IXS5_9ASTR